MSQTMPSLVPLLVDDASEDVEVELPGAGPLAVDFQREIEQQGFTPLSISISHAQIAGGLTGEHRDPVDRMLIAQAREEKMALVSIERLFDTYDVRRVW